MCVTLRNVLAMVLLLYGACAVSEGLDVQVVGLFPGRAVLEVNGARHLLKVGETSPEGIRLLAADAEAAELEVNGRRARYTLGGRAVSGAEATNSARPTVQIWRNPGGLFTTTGSINGVTVDFVVDTGANVVALPAGLARRLGIDYRRAALKYPVQTASGIRPGYAVKLGKVRVGDIQLYEVDAVVLDDMPGGEVLLGMSFLARVNLRHEGQALVLEQKF